MQTVTSDLYWTDLAAGWWRAYSYGLDAEHAARLIDTAKDIAASGGRFMRGEPYICRNDLEAAQARMAA